MTDSIILLTLSVLGDFIFADPEYKFHPVRVIGKIILSIEKLLFKIKLNNILGGTLLTLFSNLIVVFIIFLLSFISLNINYYLHFALLIFFLYSAIGFESLVHYSKTIFQLLKSNEIDSARKVLANIVGRETSELNKTEIIKATIESISENFVDGILSPIFWFVIGSNIGAFFNSHLLFGILFVYFYRTTNTLDSIVGYRNKKYELFGKPSAKLDDILNFIPARISILIISFSAILVNLDAKKSFTIALRDRLKHKSPNSAHPESATAGALNIKLGGPTKYSFGLTKKEWLGKEFRNVLLDDLLKTIRLMNVAVLVTLLLGILVFKI